MVQMCGCLSAATARASRSKRARRPGCRRQDLHRDVAAESWIVRAVDRAHPARAQVRVQPVDPQLAAHEGSVILRTADRRFEEVTARLGLCHE
jgi:hypothetical protein